jgi:hypothetical protein
MGLFKGIIFCETNIWGTDWLDIDDDGTAYLLTEDVGQLCQHLSFPKCWHEQRANGLRIDKLTDDYLNVTEETHLFTQDMEAPAMVKIDGRYFMFASHLTGNYSFQQPYKRWI